MDTASSNPAVIEAVPMLSKTFRYLKKNSSERKKLLKKTLNIENYTEANELVLTKSERDQLKILKKAMKIQKQIIQAPLIQELTRPVETKLESPQNDESEYEDDLNLKEEYDGPKNDYNQHFIDTGQRAQNFISLIIIKDPGLVERFGEYPKLKELIKLKDELISQTNMPLRPMYIKSSLLPINTPSFSLIDLIGSEFDVILIEPPLREYQISNGVHYNKYYSWDEIKAIDIASITSQRSFIFLWCGSGDGLDKGRECLKHWGFRRCEDICWIKTNKNYPIKNLNIENTGAIFQRTKEHCLMGIKGTVRRSIDSSFIHTNIDIDLIITEESDFGKSDKPEEIFHIIEHFCLGKRRLYLFGRDNTIRHGWLTVGPDLSCTNFDREIFRNSFDMSNNGNLTGTSEKIEMLRPRTPPLKQAKQQIANLVDQASINQTITSNNSNNNNITIVTNDQGPTLISTAPSPAINMNEMYQQQSNQSDFNMVDMLSNNFQQNQQQPHQQESLLPAPTNIGFYASNDYGDQV